MSSWLKSFLAGIAVLPALAMASGTITTPSYVAYQWHTFLGGDGGAGANIPATALDAYGNLYVTGWTLQPWDQFGNPTSTPLSGWETYLTKISPSGQLLWSKFYPGYGQSSSGLQATAITLDSVGDIYIAGNGNAVDDGNYGCFVMWTDPFGNPIGASDIGYSNYGRSCQVYGLTYDSSNNYVYITGMTSGGWRGGEPIDNGLRPNGILPANGAQAMFILQAQGLPGGVGLGWVGYYYNADSNGNGTNAYGRAITVDASSNLIVAGTENGNWDAAVWKVSSATGQQAWETTFPYNSGVSYAVTTYGSNVYVSGYSENGWNGPAGQPPLNAFSFGGTSICCRAVAFVLKLDSGGNYVWHTFYYGNYFQTIGEGIAVDGSSTVYVTGPGDLTGYNNAAPRYNGDGGHFILQLDDAGAYKWHSLYGVGRYDEASSIAVDPQHNVYVSGWSWGNWNGDNNTPPLHAASATPDSVFVMKFGAAAATTTAAGSAAPITYSPNSQSITLSATVTSASTVNSGTVSFTLLSTTVSAGVSGGSASTSFTVPGGTAAASYTIQATYNPGTGLATSGDNSQQLVIGQATPVITWSNPAAIVYGTALGSTQFNASANVSGSFVYNPLSGTVLGAGSGQTLSTTFTPTDGADYTTATKSVLINVSKATPVIAWSNPADIVYGTALGFSQLNASTNVGGGFVYSPLAGTVLTAGSGQTLSTTFTPTDGADYTTATKSVLINVSKATPVIAWSNPANILFGTALGPTQLNATANAAGAFVYTPPAGTVLPAGNGQTLSTTFTPADTTDYATPPSKSVQINVTQSTPPASPAQIVVTKMLTRNSSNQVVVSLSISNAGGTAAQNVQLTIGKVNTTTGTPLPQSLGTVAAGGTATATLTFPGSVGATGAAAALTVGGTYTGGSFSSASRITLP